MSRRTKKNILSPWDHRRRKSPWNKDDGLNNLEKQLPQDQEPKYPHTPTEIANPELYKNRPPYARKADPQ